MADPYASEGYSLTSPATKAAAVTPNDSTDLPNEAKSLYVGVSGDVKVDTVGGTTGLVFKAHPVGYLQARVQRVYATGTTATNILALYD